MKAYKPRIKMCGMRRQEDIDYAIELGVDAIGLIFYQDSKRALTITKARELLTDIPLFVATVAVVVNPTASEVEQIMQELPIQWLQFHGNEKAAFCNQFRLPYIKAIAANTVSEIKKAIDLYPDASALLLDTPACGSYGGTGMVFNWREIPKERPKPMILAGGLTSANVSQAIELVSPTWVDVCSGVEKSPGIKDHGKMLQFVKAVRGNDE
jgi:phosphoribosylanthranilate isomerase